MTKHSIGELKRQLQVSKSALEQAERNFDEASKRLHKAMCDDCGLIGKDAMDRKGNKIKVSEIEFSGEKPWKLTGFAYKKDGTLGISLKSVYVGDHYSGKIVE